MLITLLITGVAPANKNENLPLVVSILQNDSGDENPASLRRAFISAINSSAVRYNSFQCFTKTNYLVLNYSS